MSHFSLLLEQGFILVKVESEPLPRFVHLQVAELAQRLSPLCLELCKVHAFQHLYPPLSPAETLLYEMLHALLVGLSDSFFCR